MTLEEEQALIDSADELDSCPMTDTGLAYKTAWESACERAESEKRAADVSRQFLQAEITRLHGIVESYRALVSHVRALVIDE